MERSREMHWKMKNVVIFPIDKKYHVQARILAAQLKLPLFQKTNVENVDYLLTVGDALSLMPYPTKLSSRGKGVCIDFLAGHHHYRKTHGGGKNQLIAKAVGLKKYGLPLRILDATAGFGQDAFILASLGCEVLMLERSPIIHALLQDALRRAKEAQCTVIDRLTLVNCQSINYLKSLATQPKDKHPDVIYLDPMYSFSRRTLPNKAAFILREIVGKDEDAARLLKAALACYPKRVVLKQPRLGQQLLMVKPPLQLIGKSTRFDVFFPHLN